MSTFDAVLGLVLTVAVAGYLLVALFAPEKW
jgi:K+-transporting ATPase KdpF subunit